MAPRLTGLTHCPACGEQLELDFSTQDIRADQAAPSDAMTLSAAGHEVQFRLPNSTDLLALEDSTAKNALPSGRNLSPGSEEGCADSRSLLVSILAEAVEAKLCAPCYLSVR